MNFRNPKVEARVGWLSLTLTLLAFGAPALRAETPAQTGAPGIGFWQSKNGQAIIAAGAATSGVCNLTVWLRKYQPFQDLSASANCSQAALYTASIIQAANAAGSSMNPMLKAQMLATSLDTYFSDPFLGGNRIGAAIQIGSVIIDLTRICNVAGACLDATSAFGLTAGGSAAVSYLLFYASNQSNPGGSIWYRNDKNLQEPAKDTFDAINSQLAFVRPPVSSGSFPAAGAPVLNPGAITSGAPGTVTVSSFLTGGAGSPTAVSIEQVDAGGNLIAVLGPLNDAGLNGDRSAGDHIFTGKFVFNLAAGAIWLRASALFPTLSSPVRSAVSPLEILPGDVPAGPRYFPNSQVVTDINGRQMSCDQVLALVRPGTSATGIAALASSIGGIVVGVVPGAQLHIWQIRIACTSAQGVLNAVNALRSSPQVADAQPNYILQTSGVLPNDPGFTPCEPGTNLPDLTECTEGSAAPELMEIRADRAWAITQGLSSDSDLNVAYSGPTIGIIDSGVDYNHEDLAHPGKIIKGKNFVVNCNGSVLIGCDTSEEPMDDYGHGTAVAGVASADGNNGIGIPGMSWGSPIIAEKSQNSFGKGSPTTVAAAIQDALQHGAKIINLSLGFQLPDPVTAGAIDAANRAGALVVAGAGNNYCHDKFYPAGFDPQTTFPGNSIIYNTSVLSVGGIDLKRNLQAGTKMCDTDSGGSNFGNWVKIYAPWNAYTTQAHQCLNCEIGRKYSRFGGTSFATPFVSGAAALVWAANPGLSAAQVTDTLITIADNGGNDPDGNPTKILNVFKSVLQAAATRCDACPESPVGDVLPSPIFTGPMVTLDMPRGRDDRQNQSVHGISLPLTPILSTTSAGTRTTVSPAAYQVLVGYHLSTWDSYAAAPGGRGLFDLFSISTSVSPYWKLVFQDPIALFAPNSPTPLPPLNAGFLFGGTNQTTALQEIDSSLQFPTYTLPGRIRMQTGGANTWLNFVLDTATAPDSDNLFPSWGYFVVFDITPVCSGTPGSCPPA